MRGVAVSIWHVFGDRPPCLSGRLSTGAPRLREGFRSWRTGRFLLRTVRRALQGEPECRVVLLAPPGAPLALLLGKEFAGRRLFVVDPNVSGPQLHGRLAGVGPIDLLIDGNTAPGHEIDRFRALFLLVSNDGTYVVPGMTPQARERFSRFVGDLKSGHKVSLPKTERNVLAEAIGGLQRQRGRLSVTRQGRTLAKLREPEMNEALACGPVSWSHHEQHPGGGL